MPSMLDGQRSPIGSLAKLGDGVRANSDAKTQSGLGRGAGQSKKLVNAAWTQTFPAQGATLDLDFANDRGYVRGVGQGRSMDAVTFTRASNGTFVGSDGLLKQYSNQGALGLNLTQFPQNFENAVWAKSSSTFVLNAETAPDQTKTAGVVIPTLSGGNIYYNSTGSGYTFSASGTYTYSVYAKLGVDRYFALRAYDFGFSTAQDYAVFDLITGNTTFTGSALGSASSSDAGNGWWRFSITFTLTADLTGFLYLYPSTSSTTVGSSTANAPTFIWGAQLELGSTATQYFPTNINTPRFDWFDISRLNIPNKNLIFSSCGFADNNYWQKSAVTAVNNNVALDPNNTYLSSTITENTGTNSRIISAVNAGQPLVLPNTTYTMSIYAKANGRQWISVYGFIPSAQVNGGSNFDIINGTIGLQTTYNPVITSVGNGWFRCSITFTTGSSNGAFSGRYYIYDNNYSNVNQSWLGNGTSGVLFYGAQLEISNSVTSLELRPFNNMTLSAAPRPTGLLIESASTNIALWCRDVTQSNWIKTNVSYAKNQVGVDGVSDAASSITATANNATCVQPVSAVSNTYCGSMYVKSLSGSTTIQLTVDGISFIDCIISTTEWRRVSFGRPTVINPSIGIRLLSSGDSVAIDFAQIENNDVASSPILTTTASATRSADSVTLPYQRWFNIDGGTYAFTYTGYNGGKELSSPISASNMADPCGTWNVPYSALNNVFQTLIPSPSISCQNYLKKNVRVFSRVFTVVDNSTASYSLGKINNQTSYATGIVNLSPSGLESYNNGIFYIGNRANSAQYLNGWMNRLIFIPKRLPQDASENLMNAIF